MVEVGYTLVYSARDTVNNKIMVHVGGVDMGIWLEMMILNRLIGFRQLKEWFVLGYR